MSETGSVKWYNRRLGYGFLERPQGGDLFVHHSEIVDGESLLVGQEVEFDAVQGPRGPMASRVVRPA